MSTANLNFGDIEVKQSAIHKSKYPISIGKVDVKKHWDPTKFYRVKEVLALLGLENLRAGGVGLVGRWWKKHAVSQNIFVHFTWNFVHIPYWQYGISLDKKIDKCHFCHHLMTS